MLTVAWDMKRHTTIEFLLKSFNCKYEVHTIGFQTFFRWALLSYLPNPSTRAGYDTRSIFKRSLTGLNSEFSFSKTSYLTKAEELSLPYYLPIAGGRIIGFIPFPSVLVQCEMHSVQDLNSCFRVHFLRR